jgi:DNA-binding Lrp family transcriptional regulator
MEQPGRRIDHLDVLLIRALAQNPRAGFLELSRITKVSRATVQARIQRLEAEGVICGHGPDVDLAAAGYPVLAFVSLEIAQGRLDEIAAELEKLPEVLEAYATTGLSDVHCRVAATSNEGLQETLLRIHQCHSPVAHRRAALLAAAGLRAARAAEPGARLQAGTRARLVRGLTSFDRFALVREILRHPDRSAAVPDDGDADVVERAAQDVLPVTVVRRLLVQHVLRQADGHLGDRRVGVRDRSAVADVLPGAGPLHAGRGLSVAEGWFTRTLVGQAAAVGHRLVVPGSAGRQA